MKHTLVSPLDPLDRGHPVRFAQYTEYLPRKRLLSSGLNEWRGESEQIWSEQSAGESPATFWSSEASPGSPERGAGRSPEPPNRRRREQVPGEFPGGDWDDPEGRASGDVPAIPEFPRIPSFRPTSPRAWHLHSLC